MDGLHAGRAARLVPLPGMKALIPDERVLNRFLAYQIQGCQTELREEWVKQGATVESIEHQRMLDARFAFPSVEDQHAIADYLDTETARIDALMGEKEGLIVLLKEHRQSVASDAVMRGLRPDVVTRQVRGGLGSIPDHWRLVPLKRFVKVLGGHTPSTENPAYWDGDVPWVSPKDMKREVLTDSIDHVSDKAVSECGLAVISPDATLVVVRGMILAHSFPVARNSVPVTINQDMKALRPISDVLPEYLPWLLRGVKPIVLSLTEQSAHGTLALRTDKFFGERFMANDEDTLQAANARATARLSTCPTAVTARYDRRIGRVVVVLSSGLEIAFKPHDAQGLESARPAQLAGIEISPSGLGLHFPELDADLYLPALLEGFLGSRQWMASAMGKAGGQKTTDPKAAAARANGRLGGRPRKTRALATA